MKSESEIKFASTNSGPSLPAVVAISSACDLLLEGEIKSCDFLFSGSNDIFLVTLVRDKMEIKVIYKPRRGEAPLWDFPDGTLYSREYAAFLVSQALEWHLIPPTVIREGPFGIGSMQWFVDTVNGSKPYSQLVWEPSILKRVALFDYLVNNADRKRGHFLEGKDGRLWVVDHGLTFNVVPKLRTVLWDFSGQAVPEGLLADVKALQDKLSGEKRLRRELLRLLDPAEVEALEFRIKKIIERPVFTSPGARRSVPWPWI